MGDNENGGETILEKTQIIRNKIVKDKERIKQANKKESKEN